MSKYKVHITKTMICDAILEASDTEDLNSVIDTAMDNGVLSFNKEDAKYDVKVEKINE